MFFYWESGKQGPRRVGDFKMTVVDDNDGIYYFYIIIIKFNFYYFLFFLDIPSLSPSLSKSLSNKTNLTADVNQDNNDFVSNVENKDSKDWSGLNPDPTTALENIKKS